MKILFIALLFLLTGCGDDRDGWFTYVYEDEWQAARLHCMSKGASVQWVSYLQHEPYAVVCDDGEKYYAVDWL